MPRQISRRAKTSPHPLIYAITYLDVQDGRAMLDPAEQRLPMLFALRKGFSKKPPLLLRGWLECKNSTH